jgi:ABC-type sugar transport system permease subunit/ABC-type glycerol-3-phosphate transport system substrate-binding protein
LTETARNSWKEEGGFEIANKKLASHGSTLYPMSALYRISTVLILLWCNLAIASGSENLETVTLRVQGLPNAAATEPDAIANLRIVAAFQKKHPHIRLIPAEGLRIETLNAEASTIMMIAGGIAPDIIRMNFRSIDSFVRQGLVLPLTPFIERDRAAGDEVMENVLPQFQPVINRIGPNGEEAVFGLPVQLLVMGLFYNRELFRLAGLPERTPENWEEMREFAKRIDALGPQYKGLLLNAGISASWNLMSFLWSAGGDAVKEIAPNEWRAVFNTPEAVEAYMYYYQLAEADRSVLRSSAPLLPQELERVGMMFRYVGDTVALDPEIWSFGVVPAGPSGLRGSEVNSGILGIFSGVTEPAKQKAAWQYIRFLTSDDAERIRVETMIELGLASQVNPIMLRKFGFDQFLVLTPPGLEEAFQSALRDGRPEPYGRNCNLVYNEMTYPLDRILLSSSIRENWAAGNIDAVRAEVQAILDRAVQLTNERMIGYIAPEEMAKRRVVATIVVSLIVAAFAFVGWYVFRIFNRSGAMLSRPVAGRSLIPWFCLLPAAGLILVWSYIPLLRGTVMAFQDYKLVLESAFIGLDNFAIVLFDRTFWNSIVATLHFAAWTLTLGFAMPILLAYALHLIPKYKILYRTVYYLPAVISGTAVFFLWRELFGMNGFLNEVLRLFGFEARRAWTEDPYLAMLSCVIPGIWAGAGPGCLIYLAALKTIPEEQFEASEIDGAGFWSKTTNIVFPGLKALIIINFIGAVSAAFHGATNILIMTGGGPNGITEVSSLLIFYEAFTRLRFGPATAMAWIIGSMLIGFTVLQLKRLSQMEFKTAKS